MPEFTHHAAGTLSHEWTSLPHWGDGPRVDWTGIDHLVVLAAHPDDETLGCGGAIALAAEQAIPVTLVLATAGEASHPDSPTLRPAELAAIRLAEDDRALNLLAPGSRREFLAQPDGHVDDDAVLEHLVDLIGDGATTLLLSPWHADGHRDHEACGRAARVAAHRTGARTLQYPIWWFHWGEPRAEAARVAGAEWIELSDRTLARKSLAIAQHLTQVQPLSPRPGDEVMLSPHFLDNFNQPREIYFAPRPSDPTLDDLHGRDADPWRVETSTYERRKRNLTLAALPTDRYGSGLEIGCSRGALSADLAAVCDRLVCVDASRNAVDLATERLRAHPEVRVMHAQLPEEWPPGTFDLVVVSEVGYFLSPRRLEDLWARVGESLTSAGTVLLCHWLGEVDGWVLDGEQVHQSARTHRCLPPVQGTYREEDYEILVLAPDDAWPRARR